MDKRAQRLLKRQKLRRLAWENRIWTADEVIDGLMESGNLIIDNHEPTFYPPADCVNGTLPAILLRNPSQAALRGALLWRLGFAHCNYEAMRRLLRYFTASLDRKIQGCLLVALLLFILKALFNL